MIELLAVLLLLLNIFQMCFWSYQCQRLINKVMSRNYAEYDLIVKGPQASEAKPVDGRDLEEEQAILDELNGLFKPVDKTA